MGLIEYQIQIRTLFADDDDDDDDRVCKAFGHATFEARITRLRL